MIFLVTMMILVMEQRSICLMVKSLKQESRAIFGKGVLCASRPPPYFVSIFCSSFTPLLVVLVMGILLKCTEVSPNRKIHEIIEKQQEDKEPNLFGTLGFLGSEFINKVFKFEVQSLQLIITHLMIIIVAVVVV